MKKILFSLFAIFSLFFVNDSVFANTADLAIDNLYLSMEEYTEVGNFIQSNYGSFQDIIGYNNLWVTRTVYVNDVFEKEYYVIYYDKLIDSYINRDNSTLWWEFYCEDYVSFRVTKIVSPNETEYKYEERVNTGKGWPFSFPGMGSPRLDMFDYNNYGSSTYSYHFGMSTNAIPIYTTSDKNELYLFYNPGYNFDKSITMSDLTNEPQKDYDDYYADTNEPNQNVFERIWGGIVNIFNSIISLPQKIVEFFKDLFDDIFSGFMAVDKNLLNNFLDDLTGMFEEEFGFIYQTFDIFIDILQRFVNVKSGSHIISVPEIKDPFYGKTLINATSFNFDSVLNKYNVSFLHELYLSFVDVYILVCLINYGLKQYHKIFGGGY